MIKDLMQAVMTKYNSSDGDDLRAENTGGLWFTEAKQNVGEPYTIFTWNASTPTDQLGGQTDRFEQAEVTFDIYSENKNGGLEVTSIAGKLMTLYDWSTLTLPDDTSFTFMAMRRENTSSVQYLDGKVWTISLSYIIWYGW